MTPGGLSYTKIQTYDIFQGGWGEESIRNAKSDYILHPVLDIDINARYVE